MAGSDRFVLWLAVIILVSVGFAVGKPDLLDAITARVSGVPLSEIVNGAMAAEGK